MIRQLSFHMCPKICGDILKIQVQLGNSYKLFIKSHHNQLVGEKTVSPVVPLLLITLARLRRPGEQKKFLAHHAPT